MTDDIILKVEDISIVYHTPRGDVQATSDISFELRKGEALALIGESGCGKTTLSLSLIRMLPNNAEVTQGKVLYTRDGKTSDVLKMSGKDLRLFRWYDCAMVFQGAQNAFNPVLRIRDQFMDTARRTAKWIANGLNSARSNYSSWCGSIRSACLTLIRTN